MIPTGMRDFWHLLNLPCEGMSHLASESLDRDLGRIEWLALRSHQLYCPGCQRHGKQLHFLRLASVELRRGIEVEKPSSTKSHFPTLPMLPEADRVRIKQALRDDQQIQESAD